MKVVITDCDHPDVAAERRIFGQAGLEVELAACRTEGEVIAAGRDAVALLTQYAPVSADVLAHLPECRAVGRYGITNPPSAYDEFAGYTPAIKARYRLEFPQYRDTIPSPYGEIDYISWLPPFHRKVLIDQFAKPWWLDANNKTHPPTNFEIDYEN